MSVQVHGLQGLMSVLRPGSCFHKNGCVMWQTGISISGSGCPSQGKKHISFVKASFIINFEGRSLNKLLFGRRRRFAY